MYLQIHFGASCFCADKHIVESQLKETYLVTRSDLTYIKRMRSMSGSGNNRRCTRRYYREGYIKIRSYLKWGDGWL
eukprot:TRINITY_DN0_c52_g1_i1.p1 TRINITY_DN0_c52_g1~~TRINITY_DN0_c52_g1_i1.p1  ORF type:complete len:76 (+),score=2.19 TRINITY_DN0_c52_g1_i1:489-716(+)